MTSMTKLTSNHFFPKIMGILNTTPDSFSDGNNMSIEESVEKSIQMIENGADIIDIGGESTRPGSKKVTLEEETKRVIPVLKELKRQHKAYVSVDTSKYELAEIAIEEGADMINDVSGAIDPLMMKFIGKNNIPYICMHMQGAPETMQKKPKYNNVNDEVISYLKAKKEELLSCGLSAKNLIWDPGIGFGKTLQHNLDILSSLTEYTDLNSVLLGVSRKSFISKICGNAEDPAKRMAGSLAPLAKAYDAKVEYIRVHDVYETKQFLKTYSRISYDSSRS
jgi:dihydropteroate synthase